LLACQESPWNAAVIDLGGSYAAYERNEEMNARSMTLKQVAALPFIRHSDGALEVLLITSRETQRWIIPKGWPKRGIPPHKSAAIEARQEAGLLGRVSKRPLGSYQYLKQMSEVKAVQCTVTVFPMEVEAQQLKWSERAQRQMLWLRPEQAASQVREAELAHLIRRFVEAPSASLMS
jgi:8-oxo-dGTP pyrophosphatase MutT (NUDIX family)